MIVKIECRKTIILADVSIQYCHCNTLIHIIKQVSLMNHDSNASFVNEEQKKHFHYMTETPVSRLILSLAIPTIISMLVTNLYNTADTWFVSSLGTSASGAVSIVFSLMAIYQSIGFMFVHGAGSNISRKLGAGDIDIVKTYSSSSFFYSILVSSLISILGLVFMDPLLHLLGSTSTILPFARQYVFWILISGPFLSVSCVLNNILRYEGHANFAMIGLTTGGILNIIGDPLFMFLLGMGVSGAGISTAISQFISFLILLSMYRKKEIVSSFHISAVSTRSILIFSIISCGFPSLLRQSLNSISTVILNHQAAFYGDAAIAAMGIVTKMIMFLVSLAIGICQGMQPVVSFNYGAALYERVRKGFRFTFIFGSLLLFVFSILSFIFAPELIAWFRDDAEVIQIGTTALRLQCISCLFMSYSISAGMLFQSTGVSGTATFLSALRAGILYIPLILILPGFLGILGIELAQPVADIFAILISIPITEKFLKELHQRAVATLPQQ